MCVCGFRASCAMGKKRRQTRGSELRGRRTDTEGGGVTWWAEGEHRLKKERSSYV